MPDKIVASQDCERKPDPGGQNFQCCDSLRGKTPEMANTAAKHQRYQPVFDVMNICACIAVVILHVNGAVWTFSYGRYWSTSLVLECVFYWAVPIFFMLSGATLMDYRKRYDTKTFFARRFSKTLLPYLFWSVVSVFWAVFSQHTLQPETLTSWRGWIDAILNNKAMSIYWFFLPLFALYLSLPLLSCVPEKMRKTVFGFAFIYAFVSDSCLPLVFKLLSIPYNAAIHSPLNGGEYVMFLLLGYLLTHVELSRRQAGAVYALGVFGLVLRYAGSLLYSYRLGNIDQTFYGYSNFPSVVLAAAVFLWFWRRDWSALEKPGRAAVLRRISGASFGVYLIHFYWLRFLVDTFALDMRSWQWRLFGVPVVYLVSLAIVLLLKKIPLLKRLVP